MWRGRHVVLGVSGGIAAYKSVLVARELSARGATVDVILTRSATEFVGRATFEAITHRPVRSSLWERDGALDHITLGQDADLIIVAPATAHLLARAAAGIADDLLTALLLATTKPVLVAPAMNDDMYAAAPTSANIASLVARGWRVVGPAIGALAEGPSNRPGRMVEPMDIVAHAERVLYGDGPLAGRKVLVTAGPTRESLDPVRVISNRSSGKMGFRLAEAAWRRGASVVLISGPSSEPTPVGVGLQHVETTAEMAAAVTTHLRDSDILIMAAAPADYRPATVHATKLPRAGGGWSLALEATEDILVGTLPQRHPGLTVVGFALETGAAIEKGRAKMQRKQLDLMVVNDALEPGAGFDVDTNAVTILDCRGGSKRIPLASKSAVAEAILDAVEAYRG